MKFMEKNTSYKNLVLKHYTNPTSMQAAKDMHLITRHNNGYASFVDDPYHRSLLFEHQQIDSIIFEAMKILFTVGRAITFKHTINKDNIVLSEEFLNCIKVLYKELEKQNKDSSTIENLTQELHKFAIDELGNYYKVLAT